MGLSQQSSKVQVAFWTALTGLMISAGGWLVAHSTPQPVASSARSVQQSEIEASRAEPSTDSRETRLRLLEERVPREHAEIADRLAIVEKRLCAIDPEVAGLFARWVQSEGGKRGPQMRHVFEDDTEEWLGCPLTLEGIEKRKSMRRAADSVLLR